MNITLVRAVAIQDAINGSHVSHGAQFRVGNRGDIGLRMGLLDAVKCARVCCHEIKLIDVIGRTSRKHGLKARMRAQLFKEGCHGIGIVSGSRDIAHTQHVGFQFMLTREGFQISVRTGANNLPSAIADGNRKPPSQNLGNHAAAISLS